MFKWPDPPDGQIIVRLHFEIYWAASGSITLILGFVMFISIVRGKPGEWPRTERVISSVGAGFLLKSNETPGKQKDLESSYRMTAA
jgi:hypothetical protein